jgi:hypothetical protein
MPNTTDGGSRSAITVAILVLIGFSALLYYLFRISSSADERLWNRAIFLYGAVEALAFAATGFLFGKRCTGSKRWDPRLRRAIKELTHTVKPCSCCPAAGCSC